MATSAQRVIVVGIDGSGSAWQALDWAADEAERTGRTLLVAHAGDAPVADADDPTAFGRQVLDDAVAKLAGKHPLVVAHTTLVERDPAALLLELSADADLIAVGRGRDRVPLLRLGSVVDKVLAHAQCPVAVLDEEPGARTNIIVVGASDSAGGMAAMRFACTEALLRDAEIVAVRSWADHNWRLALAAATPVNSADVWERQERAVLDACVEKAAAEFPTVGMRAELTGTAVEIALEVAAKDAAMLVLGCRRDEGGLLSRLGPVASWSAHHLQCPIVVVGHQVQAASVHLADEDDGAFSRH
jgi:nucleotide-binding universal stress UspA family protein